MLLLIKNSQFENSQLNFLIDIFSLPFHQILDCISIFYFFKKGKKNVFKNRLYSMFTNFQGILVIV
jgi:hypothetical protein